MANWCSNWVNLSGQPEGIKAFMEDIRELDKRSIITELGVQVIECEDSRYMFEIYAEDADSFSFTTKWGPDFGNLRFLATKHGVTVTNQYEECGCAIYGQWTSDGESESDVCLTEEEYDLAVWNEDTDTYSFEGEDWECKTEILQTILERKLVA